MSSTNSRFVQDINRIVSVRSTVEKEFPTIETSPISESRGIGENVDRKFQTGGIASPLEEVAGTREYFEPELLKSSDGLFVLVHQQIRKMIFKDSNDQQLIFEFAKSNN